VTSKSSRPRCARSEEVVDIGHLLTYLSRRCEFEMYGLMLGDWFGRSGRRLDGALLRCMY